MSDIADKIRQLGAYMAERGQVPFPPIDRIEEVDGVVMFYGKDGALLGAMNPEDYQRLRGKEKAFVAGAAADDEPESYCLDHGGPHPCRSCEENE